MIDNASAITEHHKQIVKQYVAAFNQGDFATLQQLFTADAMIQGVLGWGGLDVAMPIWQQLHQSFAMELTIEAIIAEADTVAVRYTERGKSVGAFRGLPVTGQAYELVAMEWFTIKDGKIHRRWGARDSASMARQLGMTFG